MSRSLRLLLSMLLASVSVFAQDTLPVQTVPPPPAGQVQTDSQQQPASAPQGATPAAPQQTGVSPAKPSDQSAAPQVVPPSPAEAVPSSVPPGASEQAPAKGEASEASEGKPVGKSKHDKQENHEPVRADQIRNPALWHDPGDIAALDLYNGQGGQADMPVGPFTFESEDHNGTSPKFNARDANNKKWRVKLGPEVRPEVVASRLLWAMGFFVNDDYVLESVDVKGLKMSRGANLTKNGHIEIARFQRRPGDEKKIGIWEWKNNPFIGQREFNGLRVMMAVMNNWDLKDENNAVYEDKKAGRQIFLVSDVGATFGTNGIVLPISRSKGDLDSYKKSHFITRETATEVDFSTPRKPTGLLLETLGGAAKEYAMRSGLDWIGNNIPRQDARWMGSLLGQLSHRQLVDAFRAGHFSQDEIDLYVTIVESRIQELKGL